MFNDKHNIDNVYISKYLEKQRHHSLGILLVFIPIFNYILAPLLSSAFLDVSCFQNIFVSLDNIEATYTYNVCSLQEISLADDGSSTYTCITYEPVGKVTTIFESSFNYSYMCSSALLKNYIPVILSNYLVKCFISPVLYVILSMFKRNVFPTWLYALVPALIWPNDILTDVENYDTTITNLSRNTESMVAKYSVFDAIRVMAFMRNHVAVLLTFGIMCPPLSLAIYATVWIHSQMWLFLMGQYLLIIQNKSKVKSSLSISESVMNDEDVIVDDESNDGRQISVVSMIHIIDTTSDTMNPIVSVNNKREHEDNTYARSNDDFSAFNNDKMSVVELSCKGSCRAVGAWLRQTILISTLFYISISFDISGIDKGWRTSIWICTVVVSISMLLLLYVQYASSRFSKIRLNFWE
jgi:hypothetical protein